MNENQEKMIAALKLIKEICENMECHDCPMKQNDICGSENSPLWWEIKEEI